MPSSSAFNSNGLSLDHKRSLQAMERPFSQDRGAPERKAHSRRFDTAWTHCGRLESCRHFP